jgi:hypothetical protein
MKPTKWEWGVDAVAEGKEEEGAGIGQAALVGVCFGELEH